MSKKCSDCGNKTDYDMIYCGKCGKKISDIGKYPKIFTKALTTLKKIKSPERTETFSVQKTTIQSILRNFNDDLNAISEKDLKKFDRLENQRN